MKKLARTALAALTALVFALTALPFAPAALRAEAGAPDITVPEGYNEHDYIAVASFLELEDESGVKNGQRLSSSYDAANPETWESSPWIKRFEWVEVSGEKRIMAIRMGYNTLFGGLDVSNCAALKVLQVSECNITALDFSGCGELIELQVSGNRLNELDVSSCPGLQQLWCDGLQIASLDLSSCPELEQLSCNFSTIEQLDLTGCTQLTDIFAENTGISELDLSDCASLTSLSAANCALTALDASFCPEVKYISCQNNEIAELNVSGCGELLMLDCSTNKLTELELSSCTKLRELYCLANEITDFDLSGIPALKLDRVRTIGNGTVGYYYNGDYDMGNIRAEAAEGSSFIGWFDTADPEGEPISTSVQINLRNFTYTDVTAVFEANVTLGDANGDGEVNILDALLIMRHLIECTDEGELDLESCDVNQDGELSLIDALLVLRISMNG